MPFIQNGFPYILFSISSSETFAKRRAIFLSVRKTVNIQGYSNQNARKLLSTDLGNTKNYYCYYCFTLLILSKELQLHLNDCEQRMWSCEVPGCSFWGNSVDMKIHEKDRAESHVRLLKEEREQLHEAVLRGVSIN